MCISVSVCMYEFVCGKCPNTISIYYRENVYRENVDERMSYWETVDWKTVMESKINIGGHFPALPNRVLEGTMHSPVLAIACDVYVHTTHRVYTVTYVREAREREARCNNSVNVGLVINAINTIN